MFKVYRKPFYFGLILFGFFLNSCTLPERRNTAKIGEIVRATEIVKVTEEEVLVYLSQQGSELVNAMGLADCDLAQAKKDSLKQVFDFSLEDITEESFKTKSELENQVIEALLYSVGQNERIKATPQRLSSTAYAYYFQLNGNCYQTKQIWKAGFKKDKLIKGLASLK